MDLSHPVLLHVMTGKLHVSVTKQYNFFHSQMTSRQATIDYHCISHVSQTVVRLPWHLCAQSLRAGDKCHTHAQKKHVTFDLTCMWNIVNCVKLM